ncbi:uncharacterized protein LOC132294254 [Cornus florida]|uniref:uncharacterized protein LOC132294254 n=1 Tax=Cornus florida TaxID=4283 RepID=UPI002898C4FA|nr:uncharacterized protein LOC132294254 [Cornus florida]
MESSFSHLRHSSGLSGQKGKRELWGIKSGISRTGRIVTPSLLLFPFDPESPRPYLPLLSWCRRHLLGNHPRLFGHIWPPKLFNLARAMFMLHQIWSFKAYVLLIHGHDAVACLPALYSSPISVVFNATDYGLWLDVAGLNGQVSTYPMWIFVATNYAW